MILPLLLLLLSIDQSRASAYVNQGEIEIFLPLIQIEPLAQGKIVYEGGRKIFVVNASGGNPSELTGGAASPTNAGKPTWSPDNMKIAFSAQQNDSQSLNIWTVNANGTDYQMLTSDAAPEYFPSWSSDGSKIAFLRLHSVSPNSDLIDEIFVMSADGSNQTNLTNHPAIYAEPIWSPDGSKIAFLRTEPDSGETAVFVLDADGSNLLNLSNDPAADGEPTWSPDGSHIAFSSKRGTGTLIASDIYVINVDGSELINLTNNSDEDSGPAWSPDGTKIAFIRHQEDLWDIYLMDSDGSNQRRLTRTSMSNLSSLTWSPDGNHLAFIASWEEAGPGGTVYYSDIGVIAATGANLTRLTFHQQPMFLSWSY
jgi:Tol biopolymer transport system component